MTKNILIVILIWCSNIYCQDTLVYTNPNSKAIQDQYLLFTKTNTFEHNVINNKLENWFGIGEYKLSDNTLDLKFGDSDRFKKTNLVEHVTLYDLPNSKNDTLIVRFYKENTIPIDGLFKFNKKTYEPDVEKGVIRISKSIFNNTENPKIEVYINNQYKEIQLENMKILRALYLRHYDYSKTYHFESNFEKKIPIKKGDIITHSEYLKECNLNLNSLMKSFQVLDKQN